MSLLDNPPHVASVQAVTTVVDPVTGNDVPQFSLAEVVGCAVQPMTAEAITAWGLTGRTAYAVRARRWPGNLGARVSWDGRLWRQESDTLHRRMGVRTQYDSAVLVAWGRE